MGTFLNRGLAEFESALNSKIYIDKTDMIEYLNEIINTEQRYVCVSRPRRFGKSITANMIASYFERKSDSRALFSDKKISKAVDWDRNLNKYDVIRIDVADILSEMGSPETTMDFIENNLIKDLNEEYPGIIDVDNDKVATALDSISSTLGVSFVIIIDEWDTFFRDERNNSELQERYINFLRALFKGNRAKKFTALAYITGILPVKKYNSESALNNFYEYSMLSPQQMEKYVGFTEDEVIDLCSKYHMDYEQIKDWYDGYAFGKTQHIFGPNSVVRAMLSGNMDNYWSQTVAYNSLLPYITMNFDGLKDAIVEMLGGVHIPVRIGTFTNDMVNFQRKDDVLTLLIHLGYLAYDREREEAYIPNKEVRMCFEDTISDAGWVEVVNAIETSRQLLNATLNSDENAVAIMIDECHMSNTSILKYNDENSLAAVITLAYYWARNEYTLIRELPTGYGFADIVFIPKKRVDKPAMVVELKWNKNVDTAISQIKEKKYVSSLKNFAGEIVLVGINYDKNSKLHECKIERSIITR